MKKEYNSPALEIYKLNENVMEDPVSKYYDDLEGPGNPNMGDGNL